jgi:hypothetical protein
MKQMILGCLVILTSCHPLSCGWNSDYDIVINRPENNKLYGDYVLSDASQEFLKADFEKWPMNLTISSDGQYKFYNKPNHVVKKGKWLLTCNGKSDCIMELEGITVESLGLKESDIAILITLGDPGNCEGIAYDKTH